MLALSPLHYGDCDLMKLWFWQVLELLEGSEISQDQWKIPEEEDEQEFGGFDDLDDDDDDDDDCDTPSTSSTGSSQPQFS